jgi:hypothetical protein
VKVLLMTDRGDQLTFEDASGARALDQAADHLRGLGESSVRMATFNLLRDDPSVNVAPREEAETQVQPEFVSMLTRAAFPWSPTDMSMKDFLARVVIEMGEEDERWRYATVTSAQVSKWTGGKWSTTQAREKLNDLVKKGYAVKEGREAPSRRVESSGTTCVTYGLHSARVKRFLGI